MTIEVGKVAMINIAEIEIGERARQEMGNLEDLEGSMKEVGMAQPICVVEQEGEFPYALLGGERRLGILIAHGNEVVPARLYPPDISEIQRNIIELAENFYRKDFEYWEYDNQIAKIHKLQQEALGKKTSTAEDASGWSMQDTGDMMGVSKMTVSSAVKRNEAREAFPELFTGCKTQKDATKVLDKLNEAVVKDAIAKKVQEQKSNTTLKTFSDNYILMDFFKGVKELPENHFHLIEIDPPYGIKLTEQKKKDGMSQYALDDYNEIDADEYDNFLFKVLEESYRVATDHSWLICWFAPEPWFATVYNSILKAGWQTSRMCGIWTKGTPGQNMNPSIRLSNSYEMFFYAWKGQPALAKAGRSNEFHYSPVPAARKTHPTERPIELMKDIYETFAFPGSRILIPFLGSGSGLFAADEAQMTAMGFELGKAFKDSFLVKAHAKFGTM